MARITQLKTLTSLRFVAALLVFFDHAPLTRPFSLRYELGAAGVSFFFVLSGFILTWTYHRKFADGLTLENTRDFFIARFARIYPVLVVATVIAAVVALLFNEVRHVEPLWLQVAFELTMIKTWLPTSTIILGLNPVSWSIADEAFFYALFPLLAAIVLRLPQKAATINLALFVIVWTACIVIGMSHAPAWFANYFPPVRLIDFMLGIVIATMLIKGLRVPSSRPTVNEFVAVLGAIAALCIPDAIRHTLPLLPVWALLIMVFAQQGGSISHFLSSPALVRLGEISFAFYLVHVPVLAVTTHAFHEPFVAPVALLSSVSLAWVLYAFVEEPMRIRIREVARKYYTPIKRSTSVTIQEVT